MALKKKYKILIFLLIIVAIGVVFYTFCIRIRQIKNDEVAVKVNLGDSSVEAVRGDIIYLPLRTQLYVYPTTIQTVSCDSMTFIVKDGVQFKFAPSIAYQLDAAKADLYYKKCGTTLSAANNGFLKEQAKNAFSIAANGFTSDSLMYNKQVFEKAANEKLSAQLETVGLILVSSNSNLNVPEHLREIINLRAKALQDAIIIENRLRGVDAQRKEDSLRYSVLTPLVIQKMFIDKWDGKLNGSDTTPHIYKEITGEKDKTKE